MSVTYVVSGWNEVHVTTEEEEEEEEERGVGEEKQDKSIRKCENQTSATVAYDQYNAATLQNKFKNKGNKAPIRT